MKQFPRFLKVVTLFNLLAIVTSADSYDNRIVETTTYESYNKPVGLSKPDQTNQIVSAESINISNGIIFSPAKSERTGSQVQPAQQSLAQTVPRLLELPVISPTPQQLGGTIPQADGSIPLIPALKNSNLQPSLLQQTTQVSNLKPNRVLESPNESVGDVFDANTKSSLHAENSPKNVQGEIKSLSKDEGESTIGRVTTKRSAKESLSLANVLKVIVKPKEERRSERQLLDLLMRINPRVNGMSSKQSSPSDEIGLII